MDFMELAKKRFSVRKYTDQQVEQSKLDVLLEAARLAPTGCNYQPQRIYVLQSEAAIAKISSLCKCVFGAKTVLMFTYNKDEDWKNPLEAGPHAGVQDVSIVATHVMFAAEELGLGSCWVNYFPKSEVEKAFDIPANEELVLLLPIGYPDPKAAPGPMHAQSKDVASFTKYL